MYCAGYLQSWREAFCEMVEISRHCGDATIAEEDVDSDGDDDAAAYVRAFTSGAAGTDDPHDAHIDLFSCTRNQGGKTVLCLGACVCCAQRG